MLKYAPEVDLAVRLHEFELLPEAKRKDLIDKASESFLDGRDAGALVSDQIRALYRDGELEDLIQRIKDELVPNLDEMRDSEEWNWDEETDPDDWMRPLEEVLRAMDTYFQDEPCISALVGDQLTMLQIWIDDHPYVENEREEKLIGRVELPVAPAGSRSIFDDIDVE